MKNIFFIIFSLLVLAQAATAQSTSDSIKNIILKEVLITGTFIPQILKETPQIVTVISKKDIEKLNPKSLGDLLQHINGINIETGTGNGLPNRGIISMNGFPANYTLVLVDGVQLLTDHIQSGQNIDLIPIENIEKIEIIRDASSAQYGSNAMSGVVNIITKKCSKKNEGLLYGSYGSYNSFKTGMGIQNKISEKVGTSLFFNCEKSDGAHVKAPANRIGKLGYEQANVMGSIDFGMTSKINSSLCFNFANNKMQWSDGYKHSLLATAGLNTKYDFNNKLALSVKLPFSQWNSEQNVENIYLIQPQVFVSWITKKNNIITGGVDYSTSSFTRTAVQKHQQSNMGVFLQDDFVFIKHITVSGAVRADKTDALNIVVSPRLSMVYYPIKEIGIRGSAGKAFHAPSVQEQYEIGYGHGGTALRFGNPSLKPEYSNTFNLSAEINTNKNIQFNITGFYSNINNMIVPVYAGKWSQDLSKDMWVRQNIYKATIYGTEITSRFSFFNNNLVFDAGYTYTYNQNKDTKTILPYYPGSAVKGKLKYQIRLNDDMNFNFFTTLNAVYNRSAWSWKPAPNATFDDLDGLITTLNDYQLLNAGFSVTFHRNAEIFFNARNLLKQEIENLDDAYTLFYGLTTFEGGFKMHL